jgi:hypothetical protein
VAQGLPSPKDAFIEWLETRRHEDADFSSRMGTALRQLRVDRIASAIRSVRARAASRDRAGSDGPAT